jgi:hypothetical protein
MLRPDSFKEMKLALSAAVRLFDHAQFNAGLGVGFGNKIAGGQVGFRFG